MPAAQVRRRLKRNIKGVTMDPQQIVEIFRRNVFEHYFDLKGRVGRKEFWLFVLACIVVGIVAAIVGMILSITLVGQAVNLLLLLPLTGLGARRLQDTGRDGSLIWVWTAVSVINMLFGIYVSFITFGSNPFEILSAYQSIMGITKLLGLASFVVTIGAIYLLAQPGQAGENKYGPAPNAAAPEPK
jgi:uncharacterized membrane protein YhaH (DUF805 family)